MEEEIDMGEELTLLDKLLDENNDEKIELMTEDGYKEQFEQIGVVFHENAFYAIMRPMKLEEDQAVVFRLSEEDEESLDLVSDETLAKAVLAVYADSDAEKQ
jgi:hypothetical protein